MQNGDDGGNGWLTGLITTRATVMTPLLIINAVVLSFGVTVFLVKDSLVLIIVWVVLLIYTLYRHEKWAVAAPYLLAPQKIALKGLEMYGTNTKTIDPTDVIDLTPINNPEQHIETKRIAK